MLSFFSLFFLCASFLKFSAHWTELAARRLAALIDFAIVTHVLTACPLSFLCFVCFVSFLEGFLFVLSLFLDSLPICSLCTFLLKLNFSC